jgi:cation transport regulator
MPYATNEDLPARVRHSLPGHAQDIFRKTFNAAHDRYGSDERAFRIAWAAVKRAYQKVGDEWVARPS